MSFVYRFRPINDKTIEELSKPYLWFSKSCAFNDKEDSNFYEFFKNNRKIEEVFHKSCGETSILVYELSLLGICCFTKEKPEFSDWGNFPKGNNSILVEFNKNALEDLFYKKYYYKPCFRNVTYLEQPLIMELSSDGGYDILWSESPDGIQYKSLRGDIERNEKLRDEFVLRIFSRINKKFSKQKEIRIILPRKYICNKTNDTGYKIDIDKNCINKLYIKQDTDSAFKLKLENLGYCIEIIV